MTNSAQPERFEFIQALRGASALLVVYFHSAHSPKFGSFGVDIFFVLSGAVMAMLMAQQTGPADFFRRRLIRIVPLYFLATTAAFVVSRLMPAARSSGNVPSFLDYLLSVAFVPFQVRSGEIVPVLGVGWTLNYEMAFYVCCALACLLSAKHRSLSAAFIVAVAALISGGHFASTAPGRFYSNPMVFEFVAGLAAWGVCARIRFRMAHLGWLAAVVGIIALMAWLETAHLRQAGDGRPWGRVALFLVPATLLVGLGILAEPAFRRTPARLRRWLVVLGDASYATYLTHVFVIGLAGMVFPRIGLPAASTWLGCGLVCAASAWAGILVHRWVEVPLLGLFRPAARRAA